MAENLRKLVSSEPLRLMHDKLECWLREYNTNTCDQNLNHCLELIEQISKVQGQLFRILTTAAQEGGHYDGVEIIKSRLLPWLEASFTAASLGKPVDSKVPSLQDTFDKERHKEAGVRDRDMQQLDSELTSTHNQLNQVQDDLAETEKTLEETKNRSAISLLAAEEEINQLRKQAARSRTPSPGPRSHSRSRSRSRSTSPATAVVKIRSPSPNRAKMSNVARKAALLSRFSDAYSQARLDAQSLLRRCIDKAETVQRVIYIAAVEAFHVAKMAFRHFKIRVRKSLTPSLAGSSNFEDAVLDYIICHLDLYDSQSSVNDVIRAMNVNPKISFPPEVDFCLLSDFIQEICCIAFAMQALDPPLDIAFGADGEIFNDCKYHRSYDSDFTAPLVLYHVWPALMENDCVIMKGEAVTKRGAFWNSVRSVSRCRSRSLSPVCPRSRIGLSTISRSRSPSPIRCGLPRF
ncbi:mitochondria-eating protein isoform X3 [Mirounga angustirostris]|uniref:mitochondria-eating protein isoform X3 n=1 Tax=Mirounga angustirostris TaxID=9716 RepID=UPI00313D236B